MCSGPEQDRGGGYAVNLYPIIGTCKLDQNSDWPLLGATTTIPSNVLSRFESD